MKAMESVAMARLIEADPVVGPQVKVHYAASTVISREETGVGFFVDFSVPPDLRPIHPDDCELNASGALSDGTDVGFVLFIRDGKLSMLEGYTYGDDEWPANATLERWHTSGQ